MFNIGKNLTEIRNKPEHVRERYLWFFVAFCMLMVFVVWLLSFKIAFNESLGSPEQQGLKKPIENSKRTIDKMSKIFN